MSCISWALRSAAALLLFSFFILERVCRRRALRKPIFILSLHNFFVIFLFEELVVVKVRFFACSFSFRYSSKIFKTYLLRLKYGPFSASKRFKNSLGTYRPKCAKSRPSSRSLLIIRQFILLNHLKTFSLDMQKFDKSSTNNEITDKSAPIRSMICT